MKKILKLSGSTINTPEHIRSVIDLIIESEREFSNIYVVVDAFEGVTERLREIASLAASGEWEYAVLFKDLKEHHLRTIKILVPRPKRDGSLQTINMLISELEDLLHNIFLLKALSPADLDIIMSFGTRLSSVIIAQALVISGIKSAYIDARNYIITDETFGSAQVDFEETNSRIREGFSNYNGVPIIAGFIASTKDGLTTTLGRGGSDYTACIYGAALEVDEIEIWTGGDEAVMANSKIIEDALSIEKLDFQEAMEFSNSGPNSIYLPSMIPAVKKKIPIKIRNCFNPRFCCSDH